MKINLKLTKDAEGVVYLCDSSDDVILWIEPNGKIDLNQERTVQHGDDFYYDPGFDFNINTQDRDPLSDGHGACCNE